MTRGKAMLAKVLHESFCNIWLWGQGIGNGNRRAVLDRFKEVNGKGMREGS